MTTLPAQVIALPALSSNSLGSYIQAVGRIPALTREQEIALFERYQQEERCLYTYHLSLIHI